MRIVLRTLAGFAALATSLGAADLTGTWKASLVDPLDKNQPVSPIPFAPVLELRMDGDKISGVAHLGIWLGDAQIVSGMVDGDHISFVTIAETRSTSGRVVTNWTGTLRGDRLELTMHFAGGVKLIAVKGPE